MFITKFSEHAFHIVAKVNQVDIDRPMVYVSFNGILRGHFERIWPKQNIQQLEIDWQLQQEEEIRKEEVRKEAERQRKKLQEEAFKKKCQAEAPSFSLASP